MQLSVTKLTRKIWCGLDWVVYGSSKIIKPFMAAGMGATWYGDLKSDGPVCILKFSYTGWSQAYERSEQ